LIKIATPPNANLGEAENPRSKPESSISVLGKWRGKWTAEAKSAFSFEMQLGIAADKTIQGAITWKLESSPLAYQQSKVGLTAIEYVKGRYDPGSHILFLEGYSKNDPYGIIGTDIYRLEYAEDGNSLSGRTWSSGDWSGKFMGIRN
jgi:hypothetical protein